MIHIKESRVSRTSHSAPLAITYNKKSVLSSQNKILELDFSVDVPEGTSGTSGRRPWTQNCPLMSIRKKLPYFSIDFGKL